MAKHKHQLLLRIGRIVYGLKLVATNPKAWRLTKLDEEGEVVAIYDVNAESGEFLCDCPAMQKTRLVCKHRKVLLAEGLIP